MSLKQAFVILAGGALVMLVVVMLRAESAALNYTLVNLERRAAILRQELHEKELELARLRNPARIRQRLDSLWRQESANAQP